METAASILVFLASLSWLVSWVLFARFRMVPDAARAPASRISVIIPARNEESNLARLLPSLRDGHESPHEVIVVDDESEDGTAGCARQLGATVVPGRPLPEGWVGKPWACQQGADASSGDWLLFLDADTVLEPGGFLRLAALTDRDDQVHSVCPLHRVEAAYEQLSAFFNVVMLLGMNAFTLRGPEARDIGLFGQVLLVSRRAYEAAGCHAAVKGEILENFHLARHFARTGSECRCWLGRGTISMRMFPGGLRDLIDGWSKGFVSGASNTPWAAMAGISIWLTSLINATIAVGLAPVAGGAVGAAAGIVYLLSVLQVYYLFRKAGGFWLLSAIFFPVGLMFYVVVFTRALGRKRRGEQINWRGRHVD